MPTFQHARNTRIFWNQYEVSSYFTDFSMGQKVDDVDVTTFTSTANPSKSFILGFKEGEVKLTGLYEPTATTGSDALLSAGLGSSSAVVFSICAASATWTPNDRGQSAQLKEAQYDIKGSVGSAVALEAGGKADGGVDYTQCLHTTTAAETGTANGAQVANGAVTTNGGAAYLHVTGITGAAPSVTLVVKSGTHPTYGRTLATFTTVTAATAEYKLITGTIDTDVRIEWTFGGTTTGITFAAFVARR